MREDAYRKIMDEYSRKKIMAEEMAEEYKRTVYKKIPEIENLNSEIKLLGIQVAKKLMLNGENNIEDIDEVRKKIKLLQKNRDTILESNGLSMIDLEPKYQCTMCKDTGFVESGDRCRCLNQRIVEELYNMSNIKKRLEDENFGKFRLEIFSNEKYQNEEFTPRQNMMNVLDIAIKFCENFDDNQGLGLLFYGSTGTGKTFLSNCIASEIIKKGKTVVYQTSSELMDIIGEYRFNKTEDYLGAKNNYKFIYDCDLLIIDDLGTEFVNSFTNSEIFNIINSRMIARKRTIISTNLSMSELNTVYSDRILSRLFKEYVMIKFYGNDLRMNL